MPYNPSVNLSHQPTLVNEPSAHNEPSHSGMAQGESSVVLKTHEKYGFINPMPPNMKIVASSKDTGLFLAKIKLGDGFYLYRISKAPTVTPASAVLKGHGSFFSNCNGEVAIPEGTKLGFGVEHRGILNVTPMPITLVHNASAGDSYFNLVVSRENFDPKQAGTDTFGHIPDYYFRRYVPERKIRAELTDRMNRGFGSSPIHSHDYIFSKKKLIHSHNKLSHIFHALELNKISYKVIKMQICRASLSDVLQKYKLVKLVNRVLLNRYPLEA